MAGTTPTLLVICPTDDARYPHIKDGQIQSLTGRAKNDYDKMESNPR